MISSISQFIHSNGYVQFLCVCPLLLSLSLAPASKKKKRINEKVVEKEEKEEEEAEEGRTTKEQNPLSASLELNGEKKETRER